MKRSEGPEKLGPEHIFGRFFDPCRGFYTSRRKSLRRFPYFQKNASLIPLRFFRRIDEISHYFCQLATSPLQGLEFYIQHDSLAMCCVQGHARPRQGPHRFVLRSPEPQGHARQPRTRAPTGLARPPPDSRVPRKSANADGTDAGPKQTFAS